MPTIRTPTSAAAALNTAEAEAIINLPNVAKGGNYTLNESHNREVHELAAGVQATLPAPDTNLSQTDDWYVTLYAIGATAATVVRDGAETIDGVAENLTIAPGHSITIRMTADLANWITVGQSARAQSSGVIAQPGGLAAHTGLTMSCSTGAVIDLDATELLLTDGTYFHKASAVNLTLTLTGGAGALSVDTGTLATGWYYIWAVSDGTTVTAVASLQTSGGSVTMPGSNTYYGYCGAVYATSTTIVRPFNQMGSTVALITPIAALGGSTATTTTTLNIAAFVPPDAKKVKMVGQRIHTSSSIAVYSVFAYVYSKPSATNTGDLWQWGGPEGHVSATTFYHLSSGSVMLVTPQIVYHHISNPAGATTANTLDISVTGWSY